MTYRETEARYLTHHKQEATRDHKPPLKMALPPGECTGYNATAASWRSKSQFISVQFINFIQAVK